MSTKTCTKCRLEKPLADFGKDKSRPDGYTFVCKACRNQRASTPLNSVSEFAQTNDEDDLKKEILILKRRLSYLENFIFQKWKIQISKSEPSKDDENEVFVEKTKLPEWF